MKLDRYFYSISALVFVFVTFWGFHSFYLYCKAAGDNPIAPEMFVLDSIHGAAMSAWILLFLVQAMLIGVRNRRLHMKLGWAALAIAPVLAVCGVVTAFRSVQSAPEFVFFAMPYPRFLLVMFAEIALYASFVAAGLITRKRPAIHRSMMLLASLRILAGATARIPTLYPVFSHAGWPGLFGPVFALGAVLLVVRSVMIRKLDRPFAVGYAAMVAVCIMASQLALTETWNQMATVMLKH
ncbi:MAG TPA: hypothetical protein VH088_10765 [Terriglobales bacterium]|nr:hypothetical protein [Terriglobales bacterium]